VSEFFCWVPCGFRQNYADGVTKLRSDKSDTSLKDFAKEQVSFASAFELHEGKDDLQYTEAQSSEYLDL
jgi:hypothetical protein